MLAFWFKKKTHHLVFNPQKVNEASPSRVPAQDGRERTILIGSERKSVLSLKWTHHLNDSQSPLLLLMKLV